jgi:IS5 family transposase
MAWRVITEKKHSTKLIHEVVGVKCRVIRRVFREPGLHLGVLVGGVVVADDVQNLPGVGDGDFFEEFQESLVPVLGVAGVGDLPGGDVEGGEQAGDPVPGVVVGLPLGDPRAHRQDRLAALEQGNPADAPQLVPAIKRVIRRTGRKPRTVTADRGYGEKAVDDDLHDMGVRTVVIPGKGKPGKAR